MILSEGRRIIKQKEHIARIEEPGSKYLDNLTIAQPVSAANIVKSILLCLEGHSVTPKCIKESVAMEQILTRAGEVV